MKNLLLALSPFKWVLYIILSLFVLNSCQKNSIDPDGTADKVVKLQLTADKINLVANDQDEVVFSVQAFNSRNQIVQVTGIEIFVNGTKINEAKFSTAIGGKHTVVAKLGGISSNIVELNATEPATVHQISLGSNTSLILADGRSAARLTPVLLDKDGNQLDDGSWKIYANGVEIADDTFTTATPGSYILVARSNDITSNEVEIYAREDKNYPLITLPVVIHVGHFGDTHGTGNNLSNSHIDAAIAHLNLLFSNGQNSTNPNAVDMRIRFRLAITGMDGQPMPETGIIRYDITAYDDGYSSAAYDQAGDKKLGSNESWKWQLETVWDPDQYLNIWVFPEEHGSSYAGMPHMYASYPLDGLTTLPDNCTNCPPDNNYLKSISITTSAFGNSSVLAHEIGHALGLLHVFSTDDCQTSDYCPDTHSYRYMNYDSSAVCPDNKGINSHDNIMDYTGSHTTFTYDQRERARYALRHAHWLSKLVHSNR